MPSTKTHRMKRLFRRDGRALIVAMDHAGYMDRVAPGMDAVERTIRSVVAGGADVIMTTYGTAERYADAIDDAGLLLSVDSNVETTPYAVESALRIGADGVKNMVYPWWQEDPDSLRSCNCLAVECDKWGLPLLAETVPGGFGAGEDLRTPEKIAAGARAGAEAGADYVKTFYTGDPESFRKVVENSTVPIVILGGSRTDDPRELFESVHGALKAGAVGVAMGRNIWGHKDPERMTAALAALIHEDKTVDEAVDLL